MRKITLLVLLFLLILQQAFATTEPDSLNRKEKKVSLVALPALFYTPETSLGFGTMLMPVFRLGEDEATRISNLQLLSVYTLEKQLILENRFSLFTNQNRYAFSGEFSFYDFPIDYYGVGNNLKEKNKESIAYNMIFITSRALRQVRPSVYLGLQYRFISLYNLKFKENSLLYERPQQERENSFNSGLGYVFVFDNRDNVINAQAGAYAEFSSYYNSSWLGSDFKYQRYQLDLRKYYAFNEKNVVAAQLLGVFNPGDVPFREMARLGGQYMMRGYYDGRYRDQNLMAFQAEYRRHLFWRIGVVGFAAVGDVAHYADDFNANDLKLTGGAGLRIRVKEKERVNIRIDYGIGKNSSGLYFGIGEVF